MKKLLTIIIEGSLPVVLLLFAFSCKQANEVDASPPKVIITSPAEGDTLNGPITITTVINDNVGVARAELYVDNVLTTQVSSKPFTFYWYVAYWADGRSHTLQVKARDPSGNIGSSQVVTVTVSTVAIASPVLVAPTGNQFLDTPATTLLWRPVPSAKSYEIQVTTATDTTALVLSRTTQDTFCVATNLTYADYLWRVRAIGPNGDPSGWSQGGSFTLLLPPPVALSPIAGMLTENAQTSFLWSKVRKAVQYKISVAQDSLFASVLYSTTVGDTFTTAINLPHIIRLFWHIRAVALGGNTGHWGATQFFSRFNTFLETIDTQTIDVIQTTADSGFLVGGGQSVTKFDRYGTVKWQKTYSGIVASLRPISTGGIILAGTTPGNLAWAVRTDDLGTVQWERTYGSQPSSFASADKLRDGNFICCGLNDSAAWIVVLNPGGDTVWTQAPGITELNYVEATHDGGALLAGSRYDGSLGAISSPANFRKIDSTGKTLWLTEQAGCNHFHQIRGLAIREFADGTSLAMYTLSCVPAEGYAKIDGSGRDLWNSGPKVPDRATSIAPVQSLTDEFIACGYNSNSGSSYIEKFSDVGWRQWIKDLGLSGLKVVVPCVDGGYIVGGSSQLLKTDPSGDYIAPAETTSTMNNQAAMFPHLRGSK